MTMDASVNASMHPRQWVTEKASDVSSTALARACDEEEEEEEEEEEVVGSGGGRRATSPPPLPSPSPSPFPRLTRSSS